MYNGSIGHLAKCGIAYPSRGEIDNTQQCLIVQRIDCQTEIGLIPDDWEVKSLGEIGEPCMCKRILKEQTSPTGDIPFYKIGTFGGIPDAYISRELFEQYKEQYNYPKTPARWPMPCTAC